VPRAAKFLALRFERLDEQPADGLALLLGVADAGQRVDERVGCVDVNQRNVEMAAEQRDDLAALVEPHQAVVDEDAGQLVADRFVDQLGRDS
jgi:hypothetical protein